MQDSNQLPVYAVPGTDGNPSMYFLRSFTQDPDTQITADQFNAISGAIGTAYDQGAASASNLSAQHAAVDPASPDFQGTPAINADVAGSAAAQISKPPIDPGNPEEPVATDPGISSNTVDPTVANTTDNPNVVADPANPNGFPMSAPSSGTSSDSSNQPEPDPNTVDPSSGNSSSASSQDSGSQAPTSEDTSAGTTDPNVEGSPSSQPTDTQEATSTDSPSVESSDPTSPVSSDPNGNTQEASSTSTEGSSGGADPNTGQENTISSQQSGSTDSSETSSTPVVDPTDPTVVAGQPLPIDLNNPPVIIDPATGTTPDTTDHPVVNTDLPDPGLVQAPPAELPVEEHPSWFAKEKQRILDWLKSLEQDVENQIDPDVSNS